MRKNVASQYVSFQMNATADGAVVTTGTPTVYYTIDGGTQGTGGGTSTHEGNGQWSYAPAQAETNGNHVAFTMVLANAITQTVNTWPVAFDPTDAVRMGVTALPNAAADAAGGLPVSDAGGLDLDTKLANTNEITVARMGALTDWINGGRLDLILDARASQTSVDTIDGIADAILVDTGTSIPAQISALNDFDPATDTVANVTLVDTTTTNTDMRGTDGANTTAPDNSGITAIKAVTDQQAKAVINGTVGSGSTTTNIVSGLTTTTDSLNGKIVTFDKDTTTAALRGQSTDITDTDGSGNLTVTVLTAAPASGDTYIVT